MKPAARWKHWRLDAGGTAIAAGLTAIAFFVHISPTLTGYDHAQARQVQYAAEQSRTRDLERTLHSAKDMLVKTQQVAAKSQLKLQPLSELNDRLVRLTELAGQNGMTLDAIEAGTTINSDRYCTLPIRANGRGTYRSCLAALQQMRVAMPDVGVASIEMSGGDVNVDTIVTVVMELHWRAQPQPRTPGK